MANPDKTNEQTELALRILRYLYANPNAKDTLDGITEWWLLRVKIEEAVKDVANAISWLVAKGFVLQKQLPDSTTIYTINPGNKKNVHQFIKESEDI